MNSTNQPIFTCSVCALVLEPRFLPPTAPSCPSCGADTTPNQVAIDAALTIFCASCHTKGSSYESEHCPNCDSAWGAWSGSHTVGQVPESAFQNDRVLYQSSRGPEGGTVPRWKIM